MGRTGRRRPSDDQRTLRSLQRPRADRDDLDVEVADDALGPDLQAGDLREVVRGGAHLRVLGSAAVVLEAVAWVLRVAPARVVAPVDAKAAEGHPHRGAPLARDPEAGLEGGGRMVHGAGGALRVLRAEGDLEALVLGRGGLHLQEECAVDEAARVSEVRGGGDEAALCPDLAEARRLEERHDRAGAPEVTLRALHGERGVRLPSHHRVVHRPPAERRALRIVKRGEGHVLCALVACRSDRWLRTHQLGQLEPHLVPRLLGELAHHPPADPGTVRVPNSDAHKRQSHSRGHPACHCPSELERFGGLGRARGPPSCDRPRASTA
mmetsp:Transcript_78744/g.217728  ORF Transcript_78744/g.217728 Transcript_78744/m.217728 type:complete len:323 (-) Transcript_78744:18-986(-)